MARIRTIKPDFWEDEKIAKLPRDCRLLYIGTWNFADDFGVVKGNPALLRSQIFPYDIDIEISTIKSWVDMLVAEKMLLPISHNGESFYFIRTFKDHQVIDKRYSRSYVGKEVVSGLIQRALREHYENTTSSRGAHGESSPQEMEMEREEEVEKEMEAHTGDLSVFDKKTRASNLLEWVAGAWPESAHMEMPFQLFHFEWLVDKYSDEDIKRIIGDLRNKKKHENQSAYDSFTNFARRDHILQEKTKKSSKHYFTYSQKCDMICSQQHRDEDFVCVDTENGKYWMLKVDIMNERS